jgi:hypothetical protein
MLLHQFLADTLFIFLLNLLILCLIGMIFDTALIDY